MRAKKTEVSETLNLPEAVWREVEWGDVHVGFETYYEDYDATSLLQKLPGGMCQCLYRRQWRSGNQSP